MMNVIQFLGQGTVAANKNTNTFDIYVYLPRFSPEASGGVRVNNQEVAVSGVDASGNAVQVNTLRSNAVPAVWRAMGDTNRITAPDVREGSPVLIYTITGTDKYYWTTWGMNVETHRLETVIFGWSANPKLTEDHEFNLDDYYTATVCTNTGEIRLRTTDKNGEKTKWDVNLSGMQGVFSVIGGEASHLVMDDVNHRITYCNKEQSIFSVNKENMFFSCKNKMVIEAGKTIEVYTKVLRMAIKEKMIVDCPETIWRGNFRHEGDYSHKGNYSAQGNLTRQGSEMISGGVLAGGLGSAAGAASTKVSISFNGDKVETSNTAGTGSIPPAGSISGTGDLQIDKKATINVDATIGGIAFVPHKHGNGNNGSPTTAPLS